MSYRILFSHLIKLKIKSLFKNYNIYKLQNIDHELIFKVNFFKSKNDSPKKLK